MSDRLARLRREYSAAGLAEADLTPDPVSQFRRWLADAVAADLHEPNAMVVATATTHAAPSARLVLLKEVDEAGFVFFTNYGSRKVAEATANPRAALVFPWQDLQRQVRVEGTVERLSAAESDRYFATRPRGAQLGAWASPQSAVLVDRGELEARQAAAAARFADRPEVPRPEFWGGLRVRPEAVEFWQGRADRLHDRLCYRRGQTGWTVTRLAP